MTTPEEFRAHFPMLDSVVHLASCSLGARSTDLDEALARMLGAMASQGAPWHDFEQESAAARSGFADLIGAAPEQIALVPNVSVAAYQAVSGMEFGHRRRIVTTEAEFPSLAHVWLAQRPRGAEPAFVPDQPPDRSAEDGAAAWAAGYRDAIDERTALVSVPVATYRTGARLPVSTVAAAAHAAGALVFVDAYQAAGVEPLDVGELGCDFLAAGTSKYLLGLPGVAFLYVKEPAAAALPPQLTGWFGRRDPFAFDPHTVDFPRTASRFETGTPPVPSLYAATAGLGLLAGLDASAVRRHISELGALAAGKLTAQGEVLASPVDAAARGASLALADPSPTALAAHLASRRIAVAPRGDVLRLAFHYYNTAADVAAVCQEIATYRSSAQA